MLKEYPKLKRGAIEKFAKKLSAEEKKDIENYVNYRIARGLSSEHKQKDARRMVLHLRYIFQKDLTKLNSDNLMEIVSLVNSSDWGDHHKNDLKINIKNYVKWKFKNWSSKFPYIADIKQNTLIHNKREAKPLEKEDIEKIMKEETRIFYKTFFMTQYEGGLRTVECRTLKWEQITFNVEGDVSEIYYSNTKNKRKKFVYVKEATFYLKKLKERQERQGKLGVYVFPSPRDINNPISHSTIANWIKDLTERAIGRQAWAYVLRHTRANELYELADRNKASEGNVMRFMGHSKSMKDVYQHTGKDKIKKMLIEQVYNLEELPPEDKTELEKLRKELAEIKKEVGDLSTIRSNKKMEEMMREQIGKLIINPEYKKLFEQANTLKHSVSS